MTIASAIVVAVILWWLTFFCVLPLGIRNAEEGHLGHDAGAPAQPRLWRKAALTTAITAVLFVIVYILITSNLYSFRHQLDESVTGG